MNTYEGQQQGSRETVKELLAVASLPGGLLVSSLTGNALLTRDHTSPHENNFVSTEIGVDVTVSVQDAFLGLGTGLGLAAAVASARFFKKRA